MTIAKIRKVLIANRGEISCRISQTLRSLGIRSVAVYTEVDQYRPHRWQADESVNLGEARAYLDVDKIIDAAQSTGCDAIHPGYGFLSENPSLSAACEKAGIIFIGPNAQTIKAFGDKKEARILAEKNGVPVVPGAHTCESPDEAMAVAEQVGFPILLKAAAGGGGKGMRQVHKKDEISSAFESAQHEALVACGDSRLLVEKYVYPARHIEVQIIAYPGKAVAVGTRECSLQRRYQKVFEEGPARAIRPETVDALYSYAESLLGAADYRGVATVEFLVDEQGGIYFLEVNTRLQVEHPVTELTTGLDLVEWQLIVATEDRLPQREAPTGHAIELRINAEDAFAGFLPQSGDIAFLEWPKAPWVRVDSGIETGSLITLDYDNMLAKLIVYGADREQALKRLRAALDDTHILGLTTNVPFLRELLSREFVQTNATYTHTLEAETWAEPETPEWLTRLTENNPGLLSGAVNSSGAGSAPGLAGDRYSPWQQLGAMRMGGE